MKSMADIRELVADGRMTAHQITAILVCVGLNMLDGFDVLVMSFTAPGVSLTWNLTGSQVGVLLSAGLVGMALGSLFLAPRADRFGRRAIVMTSVFIVSVGMLVSAVAQNYWQLAALRALTGIGIGGILASATVLVNEYSSTKWRNTASYLYTSGYSIGGTVGGAIAALLISRSGWRAAFAFGGIVSFAMLPISFWRLPESLDFLITRQPRGALPKLNQLLTRMHRPTVEALPPIEAQHGIAARASLSQLFSPELVRSTCLIWTAFFFMMGGYYFVFGWTPKLLASNGLTAQQGITSGVLLSLGGIFGTVIFAFIARVLEPRWLIAFCLLVSCALMGVFATTTHDVSIGLITGVALGGMSTSAMAGFYALTPALYGPHLRTTGMGWGIGIGRLGAILAPMATGALVDHGWHALELYWLFAGTFLIAALALAAMVPARRAELISRALEQGEA
jgi:MFS transporter, AAHS family, vanillate permease